MKKLIFSLALLLTTVFSINAQSTNTLLYQISGNGLSKPSYVYGTIHLMCESDFKMSDELLSKLKETEQVVMELDMDDPSMMMKMQQTMAMDNGVQIKDLVNEDDYTSLKEYFSTKLGMPLDQMGMIKPFILSSFMFPSILGCPIKSYEMELVKNAQSESKEVIGLETVEFQMNIFNDIPYKDQANMIVEMVDKLDVAKSEFEMLVQAYKKGNPDEITEMMDQSAFDFGEEAMEKLLKDRNVDWIPKISEIAKEKSSVFAVGAGHLGGENGILNLLKKEGFKVTPIL
ncbi:hypothetical protein SAMN06298216_0347 [Spirosomataceae bacterium TFI 002]|nr:hypothetical protein SAMN06298216_0347 [Spirosomataceae bacterium TFI 002]